MMLEERVAAEGKTWYRIGLMCYMGWHTLKKITEPYLSIAINYLHQIICITWLSLFFG